jgi:energy-coupling factor transporter ATP-binding protein EcfA2
MSQKVEQPGKLIFPGNAFKDFSANNYDCVFTVMHHPYNWLHPDNCADFLHCIRQTTDVLLIGHEHRKDSFTSEGENWLISEYRGNELQNSSDTNSAFSIYQFDDGFQNVTIHDFTWKDSLYYRTSASKMFTRNTLTSSLMLTPSKKYVDEYIDDPGMIIIHENADNVRLSEIYCWPDLEEIDVQDPATIRRNKKITSNVPSQLLTNSISVIIGDSLSGKTSLAKMLFKGYSHEEKCCVLLDGEVLNTVVEPNLWERIYKIFTTEYSVDSLEKYRQLPHEKRILLIDDFNKIPYRDERRTKVLSCLGQFASNIVIFTDNEMDARLVCSKLATPTNTNVNYYRISNFGNSKRYELIKKWYCLRDEYANGDSEVETRIFNSCERINLLLGSSNGFIPATPIYLINFLQNIDSVVPASFSGSQYGYLYDSLISKSLSAIKHSNPGAFNIDINIMANLAFDMLRMRSNTFSKTELFHISNAFSSQKKIYVNTEALLNNMLASRLIQDVGPNTFKFRYPYAFYYFSGRHIAYNLNKPEVKEQIDYMSQRLYNEKYGNIIIFVCHFANNIEIIESILLIAYTSLEKYDIFDYDKHTDLFDRAKGIMDNILNNSIVGTENDVESNCQNNLIMKDEIGIQDGSVHEPKNVSDEADEREKDLVSLSSAMRTIDVLGQIIMNYPGDIDGDLKITIIDEICNLGMRITEAMLSTIGLLERDFVEYLVEYVKEKKQISDTQEIIRVSQAIFSWLVAGITCGMIRKVSASLSNDALLIAVQETFALSSSISRKLILVDLQLNLLKKPNIHEVLQLADEFDKSINTQFAGYVLRSIVSYYLKYNRCGHSIRAQLCNRFKLNDKSALIEGAKNRDL